MGNTASDADSEGLDIEGNDVGYLTTVTIGTPPKDYLVLVDTGSGDFWVQFTTCDIINDSGYLTGKDCSSSLGALGSSVSSTLVNTSTTFVDGYGSGIAAGWIVTDDVTLAGLALPNHKFGVAQLETESFGLSSYTSASGILGLSKASLSAMGVPTPAESMYSAGLIPEPIVSFKIPRESDGLNDGEITFGSLDASKYVASTLVTLQANSEGYWISNTEGVTVNSETIKISKTDVLFDTGTTLLYGPLQDVYNLHRQINGYIMQDDVFYIPCDTTASVAFNYGGTSFAIESQDLNYGETNVAGICASSIQYMSGAPASWVMGDVFLKNAYLSVNEKANTIQLAKLA